MTLPPPEAYQLSAVVEQAATHEAERLQVAAYVVACAAGCSILDLLPRLVHEQRKVGPATPAPEGSLDRHRLVVDGVPTWEGGWDATGPQRWEWRERWLADPERFAP